ncbi:uncharacterized protein LOC128200685 [Galleria mellonella]|uniref:Uncharacterized protein LOC128200685 n=1 Tax=Galleria mellonella TaxID=7137 RepID=A0ABM3MHK0_GALME|nr:uncharacterized protein LOC128200685 [Galleria mellonella]
MERLLCRPSGFQLKLVRIIEGSPVYEPTDPHLAAVAAPVRFLRLEEKKGDSSLELLRRIQAIFEADLKIALSAADVSKIHRIGPNKENKIRPVLISFTNNWKRSEILKMKKNLKDGYVTEDFPKEVLEKRRELKPKLIEERANGNTAYIKYDQLVVREINPNKEKRKRDQSSSPQLKTSNQRQNNPNPAGPRGVRRSLPPQRNAFLYKNRNYNKIHIATLNVRTLMSDSRLEELEEAITRIKWDIIGLCEVRRIGEEIREYEKYIFYFYGKQKESKQHWSIIQVHAPGEKDTKIAKDKFYRDMTDLMQNKKKNIIIMGDFNAKVGSKSNKDEFVLGDYSSGDRNDNGQRLNALKKAKEETKTLQEKYNFLERELLNINKLSTKTEKINKLGEETLQLMKERNKMLHRRKDNKQNIATISKQIQESIRKHRKAERINVLNEQIETTGGIRKGLKQLKEYTQWIPNMKTKNKKKNEKLTTKRLSIAKAVTEFYKELYTDPDRTKLTEEEKEICKEEIPCILESEVIKAIKSQTSGKAPGDDKISNEVLKQTLPAISKYVTHLFNEVIVSEKIPTQWTKSTIILLHKKGDKNEINNYRPISLMSNLYKAFSKIILGRISKHLEENQPREQAGFRADYSTIDHIHVVKQVIEKLNEYGQLYYMAFVDYNKAFDSLSHTYIWKTLENQGVESKYIRIIKEIYRNITATVQLEQQGEEFRVQKGVRQGDPLSPKLFIAVLEDVFRNLDWEHFGININGVNLNNLRFADDIVIFATKPGILQNMLQQLDLESKKAGLSMNPTKTKVMTNTERVNIRIGQEVIEYVDEYIYLGQQISIKDQYSKEIDRRISNTWKRYWSLNEIVKNEEIPMAIKSKLYNTCILPCLTYGCQTWPAKNKDNQKLVVCQRNMERSMLNIRLRDRWTTSKIRKRTKINDVLQKIRKLKWNWTGHIMRTNKEKWTKDIIEWYPRNGKRQRGGQIKRWEDDLPKGWRKSARDRENWKQLE